MDTVREHFRRVRRLSPFILISGLLHWYLGFLYVNTELIRYLWLTKIFILATVANGLWEIAFFWIMYNKPYERRLPAALYDISLGIVLFFYPIISMIVFPVFIAGGLFIRGLTDLSILKSGTEQYVFKVRSVKALAWARVILGILILVYVLTGKEVILVSGISFFIAGAVLILTAIRLHMIR